jgi:hypothetical protein
MDLKEILNEIRALTPADRRKIVLAIKAQDGDAPVGRGPDQDWLLSGLERVMLHNQIIMTPLSRKAITALAPAFPTNSKLIRGELVRHYKPNPTPTELLALGRITAACLFDYLKEFFPSIDAALMLKRIDHVGIALNAAYPGYIQSGFLPVIVEGFAHEKP